MNVSKDEKEPEKVLEVASDAILNFMEQPWENTKELAGNIRDSVVDAVWRSTPQEISEDAGEILGDVLTAVSTGGGGKAAASGAKMAGNKLLALGKTGAKEFVEGLGDLGKIGAKNAVYVGATTGIENASRNSFINRLMMMVSEAGDEAKKLTGVVEGATSKADDIATIAGKTGSVANSVTSTTGELIENAVIGTPIVEGINNASKIVKNEVADNTENKVKRKVMQETVDNKIVNGKEGNVRINDAVTQTEIKNIESFGEKQIKENILELEGMKASKLPNIDKATINPNKLIGYALNPNHPVGGNKAKVFEKALGYNQSNADDLMKQIYAKLPQSEAILGKLDQYGQRYTVDILITGPNGNTVYVRTGWIIKTNSDIPELTTLYINDKRRTIK